MAAPVYAKQFIRFAETFQVDPNLSVGQFRVVELAAAPGPNPPLLVEQSDGSGTAVGVSQYQVNALPTGFATDEGQGRLLTVATSGLLLVSSETGADTPVVADIGTALEVGSDGEAVTNGAGTAVTVNGTTPIIRDVINIGGEAYVLASFS
jgi:hypothetical protein